jgi:hypothetical protein
MLPFSYTIKDAKFPNLSFSWSRQFIVDTVGGHARGNLDGAQV